MRIAYVVTWYAFRADGVLKKVEAQCKAWREFGHEVLLLILTPPPGRGDTFHGDAELLYSPWTEVLPARAKKFLGRVVAAPRLRRRLKAFGPDIIYYRQSTWFPGLVCAMVGTCPYVVEVNTKDLDEVKRSKRASRTFYLATRDFTLCNASGYVAVSHEISEMLAEHNKPTLVLGNSFPVQTVQQRPPPLNQRPSLVFAGTPGQIWHGVDKIIRLARLIPEVDFHIAGPVLEGASGRNIFFHGFLPQPKLFGLYQKMDIGIGSLALHRNNMREASPLKVREYVAVGLPVIVGYVDTDLENCPFVLNIGNYENNVIDHVEEIRNFIHCWKDKTLEKREVVYRIGGLGKEKKRLDFLQKVCGR